MKLFIVHNANKIELDVKAYTRQQLPTVDGLYFKHPETNEYLAAKNVFAEQDASPIPGFIILFAIMCAFIEPSVTGVVIGIAIGLVAGIIGQIIDAYRTTRFNNS